LLDEVVQIDSTCSVASLAQRTGRSGRSASKSGKLILYATDPWSLLQSLACYELYKEGFVEPPRVIPKPYDILLHQTLSIVKGSSGINQSELIQQLKQNTAFADIEVFEIKDIIKHLIKIDFLEKLGRELIIGIEGESVVNSHKFYPVFRIFAEYLVVHKGSKIGSIQPSPQLVEDENIFLAARIWKIKSVDHDAMRIDVVVANDGKSPIYSGGFGEIHPRIREKMFEIVLRMDEYEYLTDPAKKALRELRSLFFYFEIENNSIERPLQITKKAQTLYSFTGTKINRTISFLLDIAGIKHGMNDSYSSFKIVLPKRELLSKWDSLRTPLSNIDKHVKALCERKPQALNYSKWAQFLPIHYQAKLLKQQHFDFTETSKFISGIRFIENREPRKDKSITCLANKRRFLL